MHDIEQLATIVYTRGVLESLQRQKIASFQSTEHLLAAADHLASQLPNINMGDAQRPRFAQWIKSAGIQLAQQMQNQKIASGDMTPVDPESVGILRDGRIAYGDLLQKVAATAIHGGGMIETLPGGVNSLDQAQGTLAKQEQANRPENYATQPGMGDAMTDLPPGSSAGGRETPHPGQDVNGGGTNSVTQNIAKSAAPWVDALHDLLAKRAAHASHGGGMVENLHHGVNSLGQAQGALAKQERANRPGNYAAQGMMGDNLSDLPGGTAIVGKESPHPGRDIQGGGTNTVTQNIAKSAQARVARHFEINMLALDGLPLHQEYKVAAAQRMLQKSPQDADAFRIQLFAQYQGR